jgi:hypothetical protein
MTRRIEFTVHGQLPPKKDGANSMWNKASEHMRLVELRTQAAMAWRNDAPLSENIQLTIEIHCPENELHSIGDLDNFITGVCDGLMAAAKRTPLGEPWGVPTLEGIHPLKCIGIHDDRYVMSISARKLASENGERWYRVVVEGN